MLDDFIKIPGTSIRFGLDGIVGVRSGYRRPDRGHRLLHHHHRGMGSRSLLRNRHAHGGQCRDRSCRRIDSHSWRHVRHRVARQSPELCSVSGQHGRTAEAHSAKLVLSWRALCVVLMALVLLPMLLLTWVFDGLCSCVVWSWSHGLVPGRCEDHSRRCDRLKEVGA